MIDVNKMRLCVRRFSANTFMSDNTAFSAPQHTELITFGIHVGVSDIISHTTALITSIQFKLVGQRSQPSVNSISQASLHIL